MHKFYLGQSHRVVRGLYAASGACSVTAKLPERNGEYEYRIWNLAEAHKRMARESDLRAIVGNEKMPEAKRQ